MKSTIFLLSILLLCTLFLLTSAPGHARPPTQTSGDWPIPGGRFFTQTAGNPAVGTPLGFGVVDDSEARFWREFQRLGGLPNVGYPISRRFVYDGFVTQAFQKLVLQWRPEVGQAWPVNVFDELSRHGFDLPLERTRQTPPPLQRFDPDGANWAQIVAGRQVLLDANSSIRARYFSVSDPLNVFGLPVSRVEDMGNHYALRTQRAVFQQWKEAVPWAARGEVTVANGGDIAKEMGWLSGPAIQPQGQSESPGALPILTPAMPPAAGTSLPWSTPELLVGPGTPSRLYALQQRLLGLEPGRSTVEYRLLVSDNVGESWRAFEGGLPRNDVCFESIMIDPTVQDGLYVSTCGGLYAWGSGAWTRIGFQAEAVTPGTPQQLWRLTGSTILRSDDAGTTWVEAAANMQGGASERGTPGHLLVTAGNPPTVYATLSGGRNGTTLLRATPGGAWMALQPPTGWPITFYGMVRHDATGTLYLSLTSQKEVWRIPNPGAAADNIVWEKAFSVPAMGKEHFTLLAVAQGRSGVVFFASFFDSPQAEVGIPSLTYRSLDGGQSWQPVTFP